MIGYSKIKIMGTNKSRSMDFKDLLSIHQTTKTNTNTTTTNPTFKTKESEETNKLKIKNNPAFIQQEDEDGNNGDGESFGVKLQRNSSISSASSLQSTMKRAFSMRRSCSVSSERYCRIHDQSVTLTSPFDDEMDTTETTRSVKKKKHGSGKILKACKRLFGL